VSGLAVASTCALLALVRFSPSFPAAFFAGPAPLTSPWPSTSGAVATAPPAAEEAPAFADLGGEVSPELAETEAAAGPQDGALFGSVAGHTDSEPASPVVEEDEPAFAGLDRNAPTRMSAEPEAPQDGAPPSSPASHAESRPGLPSAEEEPPVATERQDRAVAGG
jgi:hypothetical protein